jgi:hypothetical protein
MITQEQADKVHAMLQANKAEIVALAGIKLRCTVPRDAKNIEGHLKRAGFDPSSQTDFVRFRMLPGGDMLFEQYGEHGDFYD